MQEACCTVPNRKAIKLKSLSKINLGLWVKEKREDGFHEIETIFFENDTIYDDIEVEFREGKNLRVEVYFTQKELNRLISKSENLAYKAASLFLNKLGIAGHCNITINKNIPIGAGLGGGSSNAACVLKALNQIFNSQLHESELLSIASSVGSDVPFFIFGNTCLGKGRGEILSKLENKLKLEVKIVKIENLSISTKWAYDQIDYMKNKTNHTKEMNSLILAMKEGNYNLFFKNIFNDFEMVIFSKFPDLLKERRKLLDKGYSAVNLCGSGSSIFGIKRKI